MAKRKASKAAGLEAQVRAALQRRLDDGDSLAVISQQAGYSDHSQLSRFLRGERGLCTGAKFDGLMRLLGIRIELG